MYSLIFDHGRELWNSERVEQRQYTHGLGEKESRREGGWGGGDNGKTLILKLPDTGLGTCELLRTRNLKVVLFFPRVEGKCLSAVIPGLW